jgi:alkyl sulfatase BDS1-like metallo-beta-lactamase superfamily hydrolase
MDDHEDFEFAGRGLIARLEPAIIKNEDGSIIFTDHDYDFLNKEMPSTINQAY